VNTLETTRVCVIDDEQEEYIKLIHALSRLRLGCIHIGGDKIEDLPPVGQPLHGLRLVFLDMQLGSEGTDEAVVTSHTAQVFSRVVPSTAGPLLVVVWTKHANLVEVFQKRLYEHYPEYRGKLLFARLEKPHDSGEIEAGKLQEGILAELAKFYPAEILWRWEQLVHDAASDTTEGICRNAAKRAGFIPEDSEPVSTEKLLRSISDVLRILILAEAEKMMSAETALRDLFGVLNPLHYDRLEHAIKPDDIKAGADLVIGEELGATPDERLELNTMLLSAPYVTGGALFRPGVVFGINDQAAFEARFRVVIKDIFTEMFDGPRSPELNKFQRKLERDDLTEQRRQELIPRLEEEKAKLQEKKEAWFAKCVPILLDISPVCDFAQDNRRLAKLMAGLMVPSDGGINCHSSGAFNKLEPIKVSNYGEDGWNIVFCSRFIFGVASDSNAKELQPICRLRDPIVTELRSWAAAQDGRAGYVVLK
jgi:hypothetical protein